MTVDEEIKLGIIDITFKHAIENDPDTYAVLVEQLYQWVKETSNDG